MRLLVPLSLASVLLMSACSTSESPDRDTAATPAAADTPASDTPAPVASTPAPTTEGASADSSTTSPQPVAPTPADADADACKAEAATSFVGKTATPDNVEQARVAAGAKVARVLKPGQMVTMEFSAGRLNVDVDANNVITNVRCG